MIGLIESTVYLSVTALVILLFKWIFKNKLSAKWHVWIWALLAIRLVLPSLPESSFSIFNAFDIPENSDTEVREELGMPDYEKDKLIYGASEIQAEKITILPEGTDTTLAEDTSAESLKTDETTEIKENARKVQNLDSIINLVRFSGSGILFVYFLVVYIICVRRVSNSKSTDEKTQELLQECKRIVGVRRRVSVISTGTSPMLMGIVKPQIILPDGYTDEEKKNIIIHELCHLKGGDIYLLWIAMIVLCLNWFNPVMWLCFFLFRRDIEVYCDERVLRYIDSKKNYASLLVKTALKKNSFIAGTTSLQNGEKEVERRVKYMAYFKKPNVWWTLLLIVIAVVIGVVCLTDPKEKSREKETVGDVTEERLPDEKKKDENVSENESSKERIYESSPNFLLKDRDYLYYYEVYDNNGNILLSETSEKCPAFTHLEGPLYELQISHGTSSWECKYFNVETGYKSEAYDKPFYLDNGVIAYVNSYPKFELSKEDMYFIKLVNLYNNYEMMGYYVDYLKSSTSWIIEYVDDTHIQVTYYTENGSKENKKTIENPSLTGALTEKDEGNLTSPSDTQTSIPEVSESKDPIPEPVVETIHEKQPVSEEAVVNAEKGDSETENNMVLTDKEENQTEVQVMYNEASETEKENKIEDEIEIESNFW